MAQALEAVAAATAEIYFELDRFDLTDDPRRIELKGRWFGIRGRRFVRPTLTMLAGGERRRLLADIADKPWAAEDGKPWIASFLWEVDGEPLDQLELGVAPDIAISLPVPGSEPQRSDVHAHRAVEFQRHDPGDESTVALEAARQENQRLRAELTQAEEAKVETAAAIARRDTALSKLEELSAAQDAARRELGDAVAERDAAVAERDRALAERDGAIGERDRATGHRDQALADARGAATERDRAIHSRDQALDRCEQMVRKNAELQARLDEARAAAHHAQTQNRNMQLAHERTQVSAVARSALAANPPARRRHLGWASPAAAGERDASWGGRTIALVVLVAVLLALTLIAHLI